jgi:hypothetical protein
MQKTQCLEFRPPVRNRYYYGKMLDVVHFETEQGYFNFKRSLINRSVIGIGVVCGLDVQLNQENNTLTVTPGLAIDYWGREVVVAAPSKPLPVPEYRASPTGERCDDGHSQLWICYHECCTDPEPALANACGGSTCVPSFVRERYELVLRDGRLKPPEESVSLAEIITGGNIDRRALARHVANACPGLPHDACIPLAAIRVPAPGKEGQVDVDISVRPIVYTNDLLYALIKAVLGVQNNRQPSGKAY